MSLAAAPTHASISGSRGAKIERMALSSPASAFDSIVPRRSLGFVAGALALVVAIAAADFITGYELRLAILYFVPIAVVSWRQGRLAGILVSTAAAASWLFTFRSTHYYSRPFFLYWEAGLSVSTYVVFVLLIARLREALAREIMDRHRDLMHRQARLIALGEFASTIAHELTQPLAAISTYNRAAIQLLEGVEIDRAELAEAMRKSGDQARRAGAIIQRLRELLRQPGPQLAEQDLREIALAAVRLAEREAREAGVDVSVVCPPKPLAVRVDGLLIEQVVLNLLRNAIESVRGHASPRRAEVSVAAGANGWVSLEVTDWGDGVESSIVSRLFEPFVTARPGGLGLGLSISRSVIEAHGGTISHRPNPQGGAVFEVRLPRHST